MIQAIATGVLVFILSGTLLSLIESLIHRITKNPDKSYRVGVFVFALLLAIWGFLTSIGR